jgi:Gpi18-like mannosyltransferase
VRDPLFYLPAIAGPALAYFRRPWWAGACVAIAVCTKLPAILIGPAFALTLWQGAG